MFDCRGLTLSGMRILGKLPELRVLVKVETKVAEFHLVHSKFNYFVNP